MVSFSVIQFLLSNVFAVLICHVQPSQQGKLNQGSKIGKNFLSIAMIPLDPQFGTHEEDIALSWKAYHTLKTIFSRAKSPTSSPFYYLELLPGPIFFYCATYSVFKVFYRYFLGTYFHYCGTNAMSSTDGTSPNGVVDVHLKVHQVEKLRVADASVFPSIPSAPIAATVMAVGIAAGEFINTDLQSEIDTKNERRN